MAEECMPVPLSERNRNYLDFIAPIAADPNCRIFAVLDGAFFANVSTDLRDVAGITYRALYRYGDNYAVVVGGPWLANPYRQNPAAPGYVHSSLSGGLPPPDDAGNVELVISRLENILRVAGDKPGLVFWVGDASLTEEALFKHLRRLNQVLVPKERDVTEASAGELLAAAADQEERAATAQGYEPVVFRHADANVMAQVLPALDAAQFSRLFGPCRQIIYAPADDWGGGIKRVRRTGELLPPPGPLRWTTATMEKIREARLQRLDQKLAAALQEKYPDRDFPERPSLLESVQHHRRQAQSRYGVGIDQHFMDYLEIVLVRGEQATREAYFTSVMGRLGWLMEEKFQRLRRHYLAPEPTSWRAA
jgi:hypothetical protein